MKALGLLAVSLQLSPVQHHFPGQPHTTPPTPPCPWVALLFRVSTHGPSKAEAPSTARPPTPGLLRQPLEGQIWSLPGGVLICLVWF